MNENEPIEIRIVEMIRIDYHVDRLERCQTELIAGALENVPTMKWRWSDGDNGKDAYRFPRPFDYHLSFVWGFLIHFIHVAIVGEIWGYS
ncbi:hypothetical protein Y032_0018g3599 [Ancylostoma ceylanicum]|uniref:Uncharacterized protein n=1 Tax=Ancylostoma ceylanicum TaxID=53326 RepID=A0A016V5A2_9BILA|nr:hypothetical protein Y032_0018g3599 [Ancylostoma ceylanicum]